MIDYLIVGAVITYITIVYWIGRFIAAGGI
jgi:hypothetical protein